MKELTPKVKTPYIPLSLEVLELSPEKGFADSNNFDDLGYGGGMGENWD